MPKTKLTDDQIATLLRTKDPSVIRWFKSPLLRFQDFALKPLQYEVASGKEIGPTWDAVADNDWSFGEPRPKSKADINDPVSLGMDIAASLRQLINCREALIEERRRRRRILRYEKAELLIIAADSVAYKFYERMNRFCGIGMFSPHLPNKLKKAPEIIEQLKKRRGTYTHHFDLRLIDHTSEMALLLMLTKVPEEDREEVRKLTIAQSRKIFRDRMNEQITYLEQIEIAAFEWVSEVFTKTEPQWTKYFKDKLLQVKKARNPTTPAINRGGPPPRIYRKFREV